MKQKRFFSFIITVVLALSFMSMFIACFSIPCACATENGFLYTVSSRKATITGYGNPSVSGALIIPSSLGGYPVVKIASDAFADFQSLTSVTIPDITTIGSGAFKNCTNLYTVDFGNNKKLNEIAENAFYNCSKLRYIEIPDTAPAIRPNAFKGCTDLIQTENGISYIDKWVISCESAAESITLRDDTKGIADNAFYMNSKIKSIEIPGTVRSIGKHAFYDCTALTDVTFGENSEMSVIRGYAFMGCESLKSLSIPETVSRIDECAFAACTNLNKVKLPEGIEILYSNMFAGCPISDIVIPSSVVTMYDTFSECSELVNVSFKSSSSLKYLSDGTFKQCTSLRRLDLPVGVEYIKASAFDGCQNLLEVTIPHTVSEISTSGFDGFGSDLTIKCHETSIAHEFAVKHSVAFELVHFYGDDGICLACSEIDPDFVISNETVTEEIIDTEETTAVLREETTVSEEITTLEGITDIEETSIEEENSSLEEMSSESVSVNVQETVANTETNGENDSDTHTEIGSEDEYCTEEAADVEVEPTESNTNNASSLSEETGEDIAGSHVGDISSSTASARGCTSTAGGSLVIISSVLSLGLSMAFCKKEE